MSTVIWTALITVVGALGGVLLTAVFADRNQARQAEEARRQAEQASTAAVSDRRREAYVGLVQTAHIWLGIAIRIRQEFKGFPIDDTGDRESALVRDLTQAVAQVELIGSDNARRSADHIYRTATEAGHVYALRVRALSSAQNTSDAPVDDFSEDMQKKIDDLNEAIRSFVDTVRREVTGDRELRAPSAAAPPDGTTPSAATRPETAGVSADRKQRPCPARFPTHA